MKIPWNTDSIYLKRTVLTAHNVVQNIIQTIEWFRSWLNIMQILKKDSKMSTTKTSEQPLVSNHDFFNDEKQRYKATIEKQICPK